MIQNKGWVGGLFHSHIHSSHLILGAHQIASYSNISDPVGFQVLAAVVTKGSRFWDIAPCSPLKVNWRFGGPYRLNYQVWEISQKNHCEVRSKLAACFMFVCYLAYSSALKMEATCSSEMSVDFQRATRRYIPEDWNLHFWPYRE
jgi:hypothetical protein